MRHLEIKRSEISTEDKREFCFAGIPGLGDNGELPHGTGNGRKDVFDAVPDMITIHDRDLNIIYANDAAKKMLGIPPGKKTKVKCYQYYHGTDVPPAKCPGCQCLKMRKPAVYEMFEPRLDRFLEIRAVPRFDSEDRLVEVVHVARDITERKRAEEELSQLKIELMHLQKMQVMGALTGGIAHDFNNFLTAIHGYGDLLKTSMEKESTLMPYVDHILFAAEKATQLTQNLLAFSRKQVIDPQPVNLNRVIPDMEGLLKVLIGKGVELTKKLAGRDLVIKADSGQIEQILMNLAANAKDAMPEGGTLAIRTEFVELDAQFVSKHGYGRRGTYACISFTDTGVGMDEETKARIFEPFFTKKEKGKGTGLGLSIVFGIVKQYGGYVHVYSEPGKGTEFSVYLPLSGC